MSWQKVQAGTLMIVAALCGALPALGSGCGLAPYDCADWAECAPEGPACPGQCVPLPPLDFSEPTLLWIGTEALAPACPARAPVQVYEGHGDLDTAHQCPTCECSQPACQLPTGLTASNSLTCQGPGFTAFDAPAGWSGSCTSPTIVLPNNFRSVSNEPVTERPCEPVPSQEPVPFDSPWGKFARGCAGEAIPDVCGDPGLTCLPTAEPPPPGFQQCIMYMRDADPMCPSTFPEKHVFFAGLDDTRECTPCGCTKTAPSQCVASLSLYQQTDCTGLITSNMMQLGMTACVDIAASVQLASMEATWLTNQPGTCEPSGGEALGEITGVDARTFCCQPPPR